jgi:SAM-dependent methyltransferase
MVDLLRPVGAEDIAPALADLGVQPAELRALDLRYADQIKAPVLARQLEGDRSGAARAVVVGTEGLGAGPERTAPAVVARCRAHLAPGGWLYLHFEGAPASSLLAAWRNALWPEFCATVAYRFAGGRARRETAGSAADVSGSAARDGAVLVLQRRAVVLAPSITVQKFEGNAAQWNGEPGRPGYAHYRWMRRYVGRFGGAARRLPPGARILDFGCGAGWVGIEAARSARDPFLAFFDPAPAMVELARGNAREQGLRHFEGRVGFGEAPPFPAAGEERFDLVLSSGVLSFSPDLERWCDGLVAAAKPGAALIVGDLNPLARGMRRRRAERALVPARELNARTIAEMRAALERRGARFLAATHYQLSDPVPQAMHFSARRLGGLLHGPLLAANVCLTGCDRLLGARLPGMFDSWVMHLAAPR